MTNSLMLSSGAVTLDGSKEFRMTPSITSSATPHLAPTYIIPKSIGYMNVG